MEYYNQNNGMNNNNERNQRTVQTRGINYKNSRCQYPAAVEVGYSDDLISLTFTPPLPDQDRVDGQRLFDYDHQIKTGMSRTKAYALSKAYKEIIVPALEANEGKFIGVYVAGGKNMIGIDTGVTLFNDGKAHPCLVLVRNIDPETHKSDDVLVYEFNRDSIVVGYNPSTGVVEQELPKNDELDMFMNDLTAITEALTKAYTHTNRVVDNAYKKNQTDYLKAIAAKVGAQVQERGNNGGGYRQPNIFNNGNSNWGSPINPPTSTYNDMEQLAAELGMDYSV